MVEAGKRPKAGKKTTGKIHAGEVRLFFVLFDSHPRIRMLAGKESGLSISEFIFSKF
jgi:hypothetical protein